MDSRSLLRKERQALCDTLASLGPDAPTLCEGWTTADLAAHLMVREREPLAAAGIVLPGPFANLNRRRMEAAKAAGYQRIIEWLRGFGVVAQGPDGRGAVLRKGFPEARIAGAPGEVMLYVMGRKRAARVELSGSEMAVAALSNASLRA